MIKDKGPEAMKLLLKIYNRIWKEEQRVPIHKKRDRYDCNNYSGLTLLAVRMKIYEQIIKLERQ